MGDVHKIIKFIVSIKQKLQFYEYPHILMYFDVSHALIFFSLSFSDKHVKSCQFF